MSSTTIQLRRDTAANWTAANPVLHQGELAVELDTLRLKVGDGTTAWSVLAYIGATAGVSSFNTRSGAVTLTKADVTATGLNAGDVGGVLTFNTRNGAVTLTKGDVTATGLTAADISAMVGSNNLSDVSDVGSARYNLHSGIYTAVVASTTNLSTSGLPVIDGYSVQHSDRILLTGQSTGSQNGIWMAPASGSGSWSRPTDFPTTGTITGRLCYISGGSVLAGTLWGLETTGIVTIDSTSQTWVSEYALSQGLAAIATSGALSDASGDLTLAQMPAGGLFCVVWDGTSHWQYPPGTNITVRPSSRTDLTMMAKGGAAASPPSFAISGDIQLPTS